MEMEQELHPSPFTEHYENFESYEYFLIIGSKSICLSSGQIYSGG